MNFGSGRNSQRGRNGSHKSQNFRPECPAMTMTLALL
uniref:Uncharacterized protein LOC8273734 isoform X2 n=1 Tax=Rhizophora mucronata TaxID=61149 RepID=A0A2P2K045_RHIMU